MAAQPTSNLETLQQVLTSPSAHDYLERTESEPDVRHTHSPRTPSSASLDIPLLADAQPRPPRSRTQTSSSIFVSSPLNPNTPAHSPSPPSLFASSHAPSRQSMVFNRIASEESHALTSQRSSLTPNRTSMILYRLANEHDQRVISPPQLNRQSVLSNSGESVFTVSYDSKYPGGAHTPRKLVAYPFDPNSHINTPEPDDALHDPSDNTPLHKSTGLNVRGFVDISVLLLVIISLLCLFIFYPIWHYAVQGASTVP